MLAVVFTVAALYLAKEVFVPLALAGLLSFLLAPIASRLERRGFSRTLSTLTLVTLAFTLIGVLGWVIGDQVYSLAKNIDESQDEIVRKVQSIQGNGGVFARVFQHFSAAFEKANTEAARQSGATTAPAGAIGTSVANPVYVIAIQQPATTWQRLSNYAGLTLGPAATAGLVVVVTIFMLLKREDVRDRAIRLISGGRYTVTTKALDDAATRISKYVVAQSMVNGSFGIAVGLGLFVIGEVFGHGRGFPNFALWGLLAAALRFIPYLGPIISAIMPLILAAAYPGFTVFIATGALIVFVELTSNNIMEPWLYGASTGLSTVAIIVAAIFWTWLWGPVGLLLSTPLTVCLVVLGKHVPQLGFLDVLLSDEPALPADVSMFQRLLAQNLHEANRLTDEFAADRGDRVFDEVLVPTLRMARRERRDNRLSADDETAVYSGVEAMIGRAALKVKNESPPLGTGGTLVIGAPAHHRSEELALNMLSVLLSEQGIENVSTRLLPSEIEALIAEKQPAVVNIVILPPGGVVQARYLSRRLRKRFGDLKIIVTYLGRAKNFDALLVKLRSAGASYVMTSLVQTRNQIVSLTSLLQKQS